ncbi:nuclear transport factor 2 family protein [Candidatus Uabimicrobium amorphum]|uniref:DUF4440 domain-containing protein n=1 Tax=Uabimicrobium amorphum TaxID=2596890 RepID=A0A5S9IPF6_UABAM|nr:nuclear transport factor 2 family protein [Candidatus Uabimicrobium amorphum]BBM85668.1 hypothetical protein UABAM_04042 [Candidatus Uabimicrobium amorphum]
MRKIFTVLLFAIFICSCNTQSTKISSDIEPFLNKYFTSWSNNNIKDYRSCFHKDAIIIYIKNGTVQNKQDLQTFIKGQSAYLAKTKNVRESMTSFTAKEDSKSAAIVAKWAFEEQGKISGTGVDHFLLIRDKKKQWKIVSLVWYKD